MAAEPLTLFQPFLRFYAGGRRATPGDTEVNNVVSTLLEILLRSVNGLRRPNSKYMFQPFLRFYEACAEPEERPRPSRRDATPESYGADPAV